MDAGERVREEGDQMTLELRPPCRVPCETTQLGRLLRALQRGMRPTIVTAGPVLGIGALSQRIGDLRRMGWPIEDRKVKDKPYVEYWLQP